MGYVNERGKSNKRWEISGRHSWIQGSTDSATCGDIWRLRDARGNFPVLSFIAHFKDCSVYSIQTKKDGLELLRLRQAIRSFERHWSA
jgi:hypothetical protein